MNNRKYNYWAPITYTNGGQTTIAAGTLIDMTNFVGVAVEDIAAGATGAVEIIGVFKVPKDNNLVISQGDRVYVDTANSWVDKTAEDQTYAGIAFEAATQTATTVLVAINFPTKVEINES